MLLFQTNQTLEMFDSTLLRIVLMKWDLKWTRDLSKMEPKYQPEIQSCFSHLIREISEMLCLNYAKKDFRKLMEGNPSHGQ